MEPTDTISLHWCERHEQWWVTNCPECMAETVERETPQVDSGNDYNSRTQ